jgi:hypothetical protein
MEAEVRGGPVDAEGLGELGSVDANGLGGIDR